jgi:nucleoside-diphosphate-sugar epimerase
MKMMPTDLSGPINIGSDVDVKMSTVVDMIIKETKSQSAVKYIESPLFISELSLPDIRRAKNELNWMPVVTLANGLKKTIFDIEANKRLQGLSS